MSKKKKEPKKNKDKNLDKNLEKVGDLLKDDGNLKEAIDLLSDSLTLDLAHYLLSQDEQLAQGALKETIRTREDEKDKRKLGDKYGGSMEQVNQSLDDVVEELIKILGEHNEI